MSKLARARLLADGWAWQKEQSDYNSAICSHFDGTTPHQLIGMWESGKTLQGRPLSPFEVQALAEKWLAVFGELPPDCSEDSEPDPPPEPETELPADDTMLRARDVVRITGLSLATLKRKVIAGDFPKPMRLSPRRIGWPARDVKHWLDGLDGARHKVRS